mmetsp:Transcript_21368/g.53641  ORF Transcript_21368/g.53641 Transcript_21368/m.53641 type:complete len:151 (+) Transcript_21368:33-485(+)
MRQRFEHIQNKAIKEIGGITDIYVITWLERYGVSLQDIIVAVTVSTLVLILVFVFIFMGMNVFADGPADTVQAIVNSLIVGAGAGGVNSRARGGNKMLEKIIAKIMDEYKKDKLKGGFSVDLNEKLTDMVNRADEFQKRKENEGEGDVLV